MYCSQAKCSVKAVLQLATKCADAIKLEIYGEAACEKHTALTSRHHSQVESRKAVKTALKDGKGPTEAFEDVKMVRKDDRFLTIENVRKQASRIAEKAVVPPNWPKDKVEQVVQLKGVYNNEICEGAIPGYIQVRFIMHCTLKSL